MWCFSESSDAINKKHHNIHTNTCMYILYILIHVNTTKSIYVVVINSATDTQKIIYTLLGKDHFICFSGYNYITVTCRVVINIIII